ncbi:MAG: DUF177 domain-containing protein [Candidatus Schekmanbacteria bacterium]|nr:MAG: DUF177 domain-containing protein [Candidatus Schekmanbacteria bacterium]
MDLEEEIYFIDDEFVNLVDIALEQVSLSLPIKPLCNEDCKGLCPECGQNRNERECRCKDNYIDPRFAILEKLKKNL